MNFTDDLTKLETWWHEFIGHLFSHPQAAQVAHPAIAAVVQAVTTASQTGVSDQDRLTAAYMASGSAPAGSQNKNPPAGSSGDGLARDGVIRYNHHTEVYAGTFSTEALTGKTKLQLTYTSQEAGKTAPTQAWASIDGGPEQGPMQCGVAAEWDLGDSGTHTAVIRFDTDGRMIGQLVTG